MSAELFARYAYAIVKFQKDSIDQALYDTTILSADLVKARDEGREPGLPEGDHWRAIGDAFIGLQDNGISLKFERADPALTWEQHQANKREAARIGNRRGRRFKESEFETFFRIDVISSPSVDDKINALNALVDLLNKHGAPIESADIASEAVTPASVGAAIQAGAETHFKSARSGGMGIRYFQRRVPVSEGQGVTFADVELGWILDHRDLRRLPASALITGSNIYDSPVYPDAVNPNPEEQFEHALHGLMVLGLILARPNGIDVNGIAPLARPLLASVKRYNPVTQSHAGQNISAINAAVSNLNEGDVLLIEMQFPMLVAVAGLPQQYAYVPVEVMPLVRQAIDDAIAKGIIVIEPAGNTQPAGILLDQTMFPSQPTWTLNPAARSEAIVVSAGARSTAPGNPYQRAQASNYGNFVDCFADGDYLWVLNSEPLRNEDPWLPTTVVPSGGASAAAALIAGVVLILQSYAKSQGRIFSPQAMRAILTNQAYTTRSRFLNDGIGRMPDMRAMYNDLQNVLALADPYP